MTTTSDGSTADYYTIPDATYSIEEFVAVKPFSEGVKRILRCVLHCSMVQVDRPFPAECMEIKDICNALNMNGNLSEMLRAAYRMGADHHSSEERDLKKIKAYAKFELGRMEVWGGDYTTHAQGATSGAVHSIIATVDGLLAEVATA